MKSPAFIKPGSKISIVSPAGKVAGEKVLAASFLLEKQGFRVEIGKNAIAEHFQFAGTDEERISDLQKAINDPETSVILCSRGGYGTIRIVEKLDFSEFRKYPKWIVGYSDITVFHSYIHHLGFTSVHGTMARFFADEGEISASNVKSLMEILKGINPEYQFDYNSLNRTGRASGQLIGGNLSILCSLIGTKYDLDTAGKILFIEEIDEFLYHIDRMMHQLKLADKLKSLRGIVVGSFTEIKDNETPFGKSIYDIISEAVSEYNYPVAFDFPAGHDKKNLALLFGRIWTVDVNAKNSTLKLL